MATSIYRTTQLSSSFFVESCGAILFDLTSPASPKICLLNYLATNEWLFAKGRRNIGESRIDTALREVTEETGYPCHLHPVRMSTRAPRREDAADVADEARAFEGVGEPFMMTVRNLEEGKGMKIIWWYVAAVDEGVIKESEAGEEVFQPHFFSAEEAVRKLTFQTDREVLTKAVELMGETLASKG